MNHYGRSDRVKRRDFITLVGGAVALPLAARAQQPAMPTIGFLNAASPDRYAAIVRAFQLGLNETGYVEGRNVAIEYRWAEYQYDRLPALAAELVQRRVTVIITGRNTVAALAAKAATTTIPIVYLTGGNPVNQGYVTSLNRPGGNLTGITTLNVEITPKRLEMLHVLLPTATNMAVLINPTNSPTTVETELKEAQMASESLGLQTIRMLQASTEGDLDSAFSALIKQPTGGLVITADEFFSGRSAELASLASRYAVPAISPYREFVMAGGLMSYGGRITALYRLVGVYAGRILRGEHPANLPVQQVTNVDFIINLKTAKALSLDVPATLLARADEVIE
jgi:putative ABC transport system substrate-binding protein